MEFKKKWQLLIYYKDYKLIFNTIKKNIYFPFGDASVVPTYKVFNIVKKRTNVAITGDGGDELFFGYLAFKGFYILQIIKLIIPTFILNLILCFSLYRSLGVYGLAIAGAISVWINVFIQIFYLKIYFSNFYKKIKLVNILKILIFFV